MKRQLWWMYAAILIVLGFSSVVSAQSEDEAIAEEMQELNKLVTEVQEIAGNVRFDEADVESLIRLWPEFDELSQMADNDDDEDSIDFKAMLADPAYRQWAASHDLDAEDWMRKTVRIMMILYREQMLQSVALAPQQIQKQMEMIEQQRAQIGEEIYQQMKQTMESSAAMSKYMEEAVRKMPEATAAEDAVLDKHRDELMMLMMSEDDGEYDEDEYGYDEEYEEEDKEWE
jgi:hypothetical protein